MYYSTVEYSKPFQATLHAIMPCVFACFSFPLPLPLAPLVLFSAFLASSALRATNSPRFPPTRLPGNYIAQLYSVCPNRGGRVRTVTLNRESISVTLTWKNSFQK